MSKEKFLCLFMKGLGLSLLLSFVISCSTGDSLNKEIIIYHTNDVHGRGLVNSQQNFDYPHLAGFFNSQRAKGENFLYLDAGDATQGIPVVGISKGLNAILLMNHLGLSAMSIGNHEFDYGIANLKELIVQANFPILSANIKKDGKLIFDSYVVQEVDGVKFGIFGLTTPETIFKTNPNHIKELEFSDLISVSKDMVEYLRKKEGVDYVIALAHVGREGDYPSTDLVEKVGGINLLVDGHDHIALETGLVIGNSLIVESGKHAENLGKVTLTFNHKNELLSQKATLIPAKDIMESAPDLQTQKQLAEIQASHQMVFGEVIGYTPIRLEETREIVREGGSLFGQITADIICNFAGADIGLMNSRGIRNSIEVGDIKREDILSVFPFGNYVVTQIIKGSTLKEVLEHGISKYPEDSSAFSHTSGLTYQVSMTKPAGSRVSNIKVNGLPLDLNKDYNLATLDFISRGGDGYTMLAEVPIMKEFLSLDEIFVAHLAKLSPESFVFKPNILFQD